MATKRSAGGFHALKGFEYQALVTLDLLLEHLQLSDGTTRVRPEGEDDVVIRTERDQGEFADEFVQIKKPRENDQGELKNDPWSLADVVRELLPGTLVRLTAASSRQTWVLGDELAADARDLMRAGTKARDGAPARYLAAVFLLARDAARVIEEAADEHRKKLARWRPAKHMTSGFADSLIQTLSAFGTAMQAAGVPQPTRDFFVAEASRFEQSLAPALERIEVKAAYGRHVSVGDRVCTALSERYGLSAEVVRLNVARNLRAWITEVATTPDEWVDAVALDYQLRCVWPEMAPVRTPPPLREHDLPRLDIVDEVLGAATVGPVELIGISGAGKTTLASSAYARAREGAGQHVLYAEVRRSHSLRDVLVGAAFHLRSEIGNGLFALATRPGLAEEDALRQVADGLRVLQKPLTLLLDFVEGVCELPFARALASFVKHNDPAFCKVIAFAQESSLRELSALERSAFKVPAARELRGFDFEEFSELVKRTHGTVDRQALWSVFEHLTGGRSTGLPASLADLLARSEGLEAMNGLMALPLDDALREAERQRYARVPEALRTTTDRLVCFVLALPLDEAFAATIAPAA